MEWILNNPGEVAGIAALGISFFAAIAKATPTKTDDRILQWIQRVAAVLGLRVKDNPGGGGQ